MNAEIERAIRELRSFLGSRLAGVEAAIRELDPSLRDRPWYSVKDVARRLGKTEYTVRQWCRQRRLAAEKLDFGRGGQGEWRISHEELLRLEREGLRAEGASEMTSSSTNRRPDDEQTTRA